MAVYFLSHIIFNVFSLFQNHHWNCIGKEGITISSKMELFHISRYRSSTNKERLPNRDRILLCYSGKGKNTKPFDTIKRILQQIFYVNTCRDNFCTENSNFLTGVFVVIKHAIFFVILMYSPGDYICRNKIYINIFVSRNWRK